MPGFARARVDGVVYSLDEFPELDKAYRHRIEVVVDRLVNDKDSRSRLVQSVEQALDVAEGKLVILDADSDETFTYSLMYACPQHPEITIPELEPRTFSFNSPHGACPVCTGLGNRLEVDPDLVIPNGNLTIAEGAIRPYNRINVDNWYMKKLQAVADKYGFSLHVPTGQLTKDQIDKIMYGTGKETFRVALGMGSSFETTYEGVVPNLERRHKETESDFIRRDIERFMQEKPCHACKGLRLKPEVLAITIGKDSIMDICQLSIDEALEWFKGLKLNEKDTKIAQMILKEIGARLQFLQDVGLNYLNLLRSAATLSGGEAQRIRLATQIGSGLTGVLYVLDEPSIGLHQRDNARLISTLEAPARPGQYRDGGGTRRRNHPHCRLSAGYRAGRRHTWRQSGGRRRAGQGGKGQRQHHGRISVRQAKHIAVPKSRRAGNGKELLVKGARENNLKNIDVSIPLGKFVVVSGVSGSGKSSLINDIVAKELQARLHRAIDRAGQARRHRRH